MAVLASGFFQRIKQRTLDPHRVMKIAAGFLHNGIDPLEPEPGYLAQPKRTFPQQLYTIRPKMLKDFHGGGGGTLKGARRVIRSRMALLSA